MKNKPIYRARNKAISVFGLTLILIISVSVSGQTEEVWTLENSIRRVLEVSPEARAAEARVNAYKGAKRQAGALPNPIITLGGDDKLGKDDGQGKNDLTLLSLSQSLPLSGRIGKQKAVAKAELNAAKAESNYQHLLLEMETAKRFHDLQLTTAHFELAEQRLLLADEWQVKGRQREEAGELATLERLRLDIIREVAQQILDKSEGEYNEALSMFRAYLELPPDNIPELAPLKQVEFVPALETLREMSNHPALQAASFQVDGAHSQVSLQRTGRLSDPVLQVFRAIDLLDDRRQNVYGISLSVSFPLWDRKSGAVQEAQFQVIEAESNLQAIERDLKSNLQKNHLHLTHLVKQGEHYRSYVFEPSRKVFNLTRSLYSAGEVEILSLIDANNIYFDAQTRYLGLLQEAWVELAELRLASGQVLVSHEQEDRK